MGSQAPYPVGPDDIPETLWVQDTPQISPAAADAKRQIKSEPIKNSPRKNARKRTKPKKKTKKVVSAKAKQTAKSSKSKVAAGAPEVAKADPNTQDNCQGMKALRSNECLDQGFKGR